MLKYAGCRCQFIAMLWIMLAATAQTGWSSPTPPRPLFGEETGVVDSTEDALAVIRSRSVTIDQKAMHESKVGDSITLNFFLDTALDMVVTNARQSADATYHWEGRITGHLNSSVHMVLHKGTLAGIVRVPGMGDFRIRSSPGRGQIVEEIDPFKFLPCGTGPAHAIKANGLHQHAAGDNGATGALCTVIDVMIVYTPQARDLEGGTAAIEAIAILAVDETNYSFINSLVNARVRLVHVGEVDYVESENFFTEIERLQNPTDGFMDEVHALRDLHGADAVGLLVSHTQGGIYCGVGYLMQDLTSDFEQWAFSVSNSGCAAGGYTFAHELGHNMGCHHDRDNASQGVFDFSYGYRFIGDDSMLYRTVMAYSPGNRISHFSNPNVTYQGQPTGLPEGHTNKSGEPDSADNARSLNLTAPTVSAFRNEPSGGGGPSWSNLWATPVMIQAFDAAAGDRFGSAVAMDGDLAIVGAWQADHVTTDAGAAYIYRYNETTETWDEQAKIVAPDAQFNDRFGVAVAIHNTGNGGGVAVVGAYQTDQGGRDAGSVYVFRRDFAGWQYEAKFRGDDTVGGDNFGRSVAVVSTNVGEVIISGAMNNDEGGTNTGAAYIFRRIFGVWTQEQKLRASDAAPLDQFGTAVALKTLPSTGEIYALIGSWKDDIVIDDKLTIFDCGSAYVFKYDPFTLMWIEFAKLTAPDAAFNDQMGTALALDITEDAKVATVGAWMADGPFLNNGAAYVFRDSGQGWQFEAKLTSMSPGASDRFGNSVAIDGDIALVGSYLNDASVSASDTGAVYAYRYVNSGTWLAGSQISAPDALASDHFGYSIALEGEVAAITAWQRRIDEDNLFAGAVYFTRGLPFEDCNENGVPDSCDLLFGTSQDANKNGIPDECEIPKCPTDITGDGFINANDLLAVINGWGACPPRPDPCPADVSPQGPPMGDGVVNVNDLLAIINTWGPCE